MPKCDGVLACRHISRRTISLPPQRVLPSLCFATVITSVYFIAAMINRLIATTCVKHNASVQKKGINWIVFL